ncbi:MAG TPA: hypothetical protein VMS38_01910 [Pseudorhodoferax sp.]|nr:hypothetical protein [Pseudorhodoferax sp.]
MRARNSRLVIALALAAALHVAAQTSPARGPLPEAAVPADDMPLDDYLGLLRQIAPAAREGALSYLGAMQLRCGQALGTAGLRRAMAQDGGDPVLMGMIRAAQQRDATAQRQLAMQVRCPTGARP